MATQFIRLEGYGTRPGRFAKPHQTAQAVLAEAARTRGSVPHIRRPAAANLLHGVNPTELQAQLETLQKAARDRRGARIRTTSTILYAIVASYPTAWKELGTEEERQGYERWRGATTLWLERQFGDQLVSVVEHVDEPHPHIHAFAFPRLDARNCVDHSLHPGYAARLQASSKGVDGKELERAYRRGMRSWQDDYHRDVSQTFDHARLGPRRARFRRDTALVHRSLDEVLHSASLLASNILALAGPHAKLAASHGVEFERLVALRQLIEETRFNLLGGRIDAVRELDAALLGFQTEQTKTTASLNQDEKTEQPLEGPISLHPEEDGNSDDDPGPQDFAEQDYNQEDDPGHGEDMDLSDEPPDPESTELEWSNVDDEVPEDDGTW